MWGAPQGINNTLVTPDVVSVTAHNGDPAANFQAYYPEQSADHVLPQSQFKDDGAGGKFCTLNACPEANLTNAASWAKYGISFAGSIAPAGVTKRPDVVGLCGPVDTPTPGVPA